MTRLSGDFLSTNDLIEHIMLLMLVAEKLYILQLLQHKWYRLDEFLEVQTKHLFTTDLGRGK